MRPALCQDFLFYFVLFYPVVSWVAVKYKYKNKGSKLWKIEYILEENTISVFILKNYTKF